jgi:hypothetical protein
VTSFWKILIEKQRDGCPPVVPSEEHWKDVYRNLDNLEEVMLI